MAFEQRVISARGHLQEKFVRCSSRGIEQSFASPLPAASHRAPTNPRFFRPRDCAIDDFASIGKLP